jgi:glycerol uptake facilitator-like aquaporin
MASSSDTWQRMIAEAVGTFALVFAGTGAIVVDATTGGRVTHVGVALTFGLVVTAMIYSVGRRSRPPPGCRPSASRW